MAMVSIVKNNTNTLVDNSIRKNDNNKKIKFAIAKMLAFAFLYEFICSFNISFDSLFKSSNNLFSSFSIFVNF